MQSGTNTYKIVHLQNEYNFRANKQKYGDN